MYRKPVVTFVKERDWAPPEPTAKHHATEMDADVVAKHQDSNPDAIVKKQAKKAKVEAMQPSVAEAKKEKEKQRKRAKEEDESAPAPASKKKPKKKKKKQHTKDTVAAEDE